MLKPGTKASVRHLSLRGAACGPKVRVRRKKPNAPARGPAAAGEREPSTGLLATVTTTTIDDLLRILRTRLHALYATADATQYDNNSQQAFRFFTPTNTITPEGFHHKVAKLGIRATRNLINELFRLVDQEDVGELTFAAFARRIYLPAGYFRFSHAVNTVDTTSAAKPAEVRPPVPARPSRPQSASSSRSQVSANGASPSPRRRMPGSSSCPSSSSPSPSPTPQTTVGNGAALVYEDTTLVDLERCIAAKLEQKTSRSTDRSGQAAFRFFTKSEGITFAELHHRLAALQIHLSSNKCRALFDHFDTDGNGTIDLAELTTALYRNEKNEREVITGGHDNGSQYGTTHSSRTSGCYDVEAGASLSIQQILIKLREKLEQHTSKETDRFRQAFKIFAKSSGITPSDFNIAMVKLGLKFSEAQLAELFDLFDFDRSGDLDLNEFVQGVMLDDPSASVWYSLKDKQKVEASRRELYSMAVQSVKSSWTLADIEQMLRAKIEQRTSRSSDGFRQAFRIFKKSNGITPREFHEALVSIGLELDRCQADELFQRFDTDGSGAIDLNEFIHGVLPPDYTGRQWVAAADEMHREAAEQKALAAKTNPDRYMTEIEMEAWSLDEIEKRIRDKIQQTTSRSSDTFRQALKIFKKTNHVTESEFRERLLALGFRLTPSQCHGLFARYDSDNSNDIDLQEFCQRILPPDYTGDGDYWSHSTKYHELRARDQLELVKRSRNGLLALPTFDEARVRYTRGQYHERSFKDLQEEADETICERADTESLSSTATSTHTASHRPTTPRPVVRPTSAASARRNDTSLLQSPRASQASLHHQASASGVNATTTKATATVSASPRRPMTPRRMHESSLEFEDEEELITDDNEEGPDDVADARFTMHALRILRAKRFEAAQRRQRREGEATSRSRHHGHTQGAKPEENEEGSEDYDDTRSRSSRCSRSSRASSRASSTTSFSSSVQRAVGAAKFTPSRSNPLRLQRYIRMTATSKAGPSKEPQSPRQHSNQTNPTPANRPTRPLSPRP